MTGIRSLAWWFGIAAALLLFAVLPLPLSAEVEARLAAITTPVVTAMRDTARPVTDVLVHAGHLRQVTGENAALRQEVARLTAETVTLQETLFATTQAAELDRAAAALGTRVTGAVLLRDPAPGRQRLLVALGTREGVRVGQPVLGPGATLVGTVIATDETRSRVRLLHDRDSAIAVLLQPSRAQAALVGDGEALSLDLLPAATPAAAGDLILSSTLGGLLPPNLLVGRIARIETRSEELFARVTVDPLVDYDRLEQVVILTSFEPTVPGTGGVAR